MSKKLYRSRTDKKIAGVCGGLADYTGIDATVIRIIFIVLLLTAIGPGLLPYLILWIFMPIEPRGQINDQ